MKRTLATLVAAAALAGSAHAAAPKPRIEGSWAVVVDTGDDFTYQARMTFAPGRSSTEGSVITTSEIDFTPPYPCVATQGAWVQTGPRTFATTQHSYCFLGAPGDPAATLKLRDVITISADGNGFTGSEEVDFVTFDGSNEEIHATAPITGTRLVVEAQ
jgi:hypothetical protein